MSTDSSPAGTPHPTLAALLVRPDATVETVNLPGDDNLPAMYAAIGCSTVDAVEVRIGIDAWIDDEGRINGSDINEPGTVIARWYGAQCTDLYGPVLFTGGPDSNGDTRALSETWQRHIREHCADMRGDDEDDAEELAAAASRRLLDYDSGPGGDDTPISRETRDEQLRQIGESLRRPQAW